MEAISRNSTSLFMGLLFDGGVFLAGENSVTLVNDDVSSAFKVEPSDDIPSLRLLNFPPLILMTPTTALHTIKAGMYTLAQKIN